MKLPDLKPGKYVVAVSGGVDSMVLLDLLSNLSGVEIIVAHFNHGIREDSDQDEELVILTSHKYELPIEIGYGNLGSKVSEELARKARYNFLNLVKAKHNAQAIITAHHQDDLIETALINILRGTGPQGLVAISDNKQVLRPLLGFSKQEIIEYAKAHNLDWREDPSNVQTDYLRNYIRHNLVNKMSTDERQKILKNIEQVAQTKHSKDELVSQLSDAIYKDKKIDRQKFSVLPSEVANELIVYWLRQIGIKDFDKKTVERANLAIRTARGDTRHNLKKGLDLTVSKLTAQFTVTD